jgi:chromosome partitioning protein
MEPVSHMKIIAITSQKGGAGKTTLTAHLSVMASMQEKSTAIIDTDPQGSLADWWNARECESPHFLPISISDLSSKLSDLEKAGIEYLFIDTPPATTFLISQVMEIADLIIIPTRPSPVDIRAVAATIKLADIARKRTVFVLNSAKPRTKITSQAAIELSQYGTVAPITIHDRLDFSACMANGKTVQEIEPDGKSSKEIKDLFNYISAQISRSTKA